MTMTRPHVAQDTLIVEIVFNEPMAGDSAAPAIVHGAARVDEPRPGPAELVRRPRPVHVRDPASCCRISPRLTAGTRGLRCARALHRSRHRCRRHVGRLAVARAEQCGTVAAGWSAGELDLLARSGRGRQDAPRDRVVRACRRRAARVAAAGRPATVARDSGLHAAARGERRPGDLRAVGRGGAGGSRVLVGQIVRARLPERARAGVDRTQPHLAPPGQLTNPRFVYRSSVSSLPAQVPLVRAASPMAIAPLASLEVRWRRCCSAWRPCRPGSHAGAGANTLRILYNLLVHSHWRRPTCEPRCPCFTGGGRSIRVRTASSRPRLRVSYQTGGASPTRHSRAPGSRWI